MPLFIRAFPKTAPLGRPSLTEYVALGSSPLRLGASACTWQYQQ